MQLDILCQGSVGNHSAIFCQLFAGAYMNSRALFFMHETSGKPLSFAPTVYLKSTLSGFPRRNQVVPLDSISTL